MSGNELRDAAIAGIRAIMISNPAVSGYADDVLAIIQGRKIAVEAAAARKEQPSDGGIMKPKEVARLFGVGVRTLERYAREGLLQRVTPGMGKRSIGYTRESVEKWYHHDKEGVR